MSGNGNGNGNGTGRPVPTMRYVAEQFIELFSDPKRHVQGPYAVDGNRVPVAATEERAQAFCLAGASHRALYVASLRGDDALHDAILDFRTKLDIVAAPYSPIGISDKRGRAAILEYIKRVRDEATA